MDCTRVLWFDVIDLLGLTNKSGFIQCRPLRVGEEEGSVELHVLDIDLLMANLSI